MATGKTKSRNGAKAKPASAPVKEFPEVLTLAEAAEYLRVSEEDVAELAGSGELPGRKVRNQWRFHRQALADWLSKPTRMERLLRHAGAAKDDPFLDEIVEGIYRDRGRPIVEDTK